MRGKWGITWLAAAALIVSLTYAPVTGLAAEAWEKGGMPLTMTGAQNSLEAQMLGEKPFQSRTANGLLSTTAPGQQLDQEAGAVLKLPLNLEMRISVLYDRESGRLEPQKRSDASLFMKSSLDYRLLPNLQVGLNSYLYRPESDSLSLSRQFSGQVMGLGPGLKYDLGRWSFLLKTQVETGNRERGVDALQGTVRVWYAF